MADLKKSVAGRGGAEKKFSALWRGMAVKILIVAEFRHGGIRSLWRKFGMADKNRRGKKSPWRKIIAAAENRCGGKSLWLKKIFVFSRVQSFEIHRTKIFDKKAKIGKFLTKSFHSCR